MSAQWAPFNVRILIHCCGLYRTTNAFHCGQAKYRWRNTTDNLVIHDPELTVLNSYIGGMFYPTSPLDRNSFYNGVGAFQQTTSGLAITNQDCYELGKRCYSVFGFEYVPG
jgi:hypothetical protein